MQKAQLAWKKERLTPFFLFGSHPKTLRFPGAHQTRDLAFGIYLKILYTVRSRSSGWHHGRETKRL
jgi:hypothetical protein